LSSACSTEIKNPLQPFVKTRAEGGFNNQADKTTCKI
jgi:hypothetical protein